MLKKINIKILLSAAALLLSVIVTAADRTVALGGDIQDAIDDVSSSGGGTVTLAAGTFTVTTSIKIKSNVKLQGSGTYATTIKTTKNIKIIEQAGYGLKNVSFHNLTLIGTNAIDGGGIDFISYGTDHNTVTLTNIRCYNTGWGVHIKGAKNVTIENCDFSKNGTKGKEYYAHNMYLRRVYDATVKNSSFNYSTSANGINISYSEDIKIKNCEMIGNYFRGVRAADTDGYLVHDCIIADNDNVGLLANTEKVVTKNIDWANNCITNNGVGLETKNGATGSVTNCNSYGNGSNFKLVSSVSQKNNSSDSNKKCGSVTVPIPIPIPTPEPTTCKLPWSDSKFTVSDKKVNYTKTIDISCASNVEITMDLKGEGKMETADYINVYYKVDGSSIKTIAKYTDSFDTKSIKASDISGDSLEIIIQAYTSYVGEVYTISNIEVNTNEAQDDDPIPSNSTLVHIKKRNATGFAIDGQKHGTNAQNIYLWSSDSSNENQQWIEIDRGNGYYSYQKQGTNYCIDGNHGGASGQNVYLWYCNDTNQNQQWKKVSVGSGAFRLEKRNASGFSLNGGNGGSNRQNIGLFSSKSTSQNLHWIITPVSGAKVAKPEVLENNTSIYPNPASNELNIDLRNSRTAKVTVINISGQIVKAFDITEGSTTVDISQLTTGLYTVKIFNESNSPSIRKLMIK